MNVPSLEQDEHVKFNKLINKLVCVCGCILSLKESNK